jgi:hypothetical protein
MKKKMIPFLLFLCFFFSISVWAQTNAGLIIKFKSGIEYQVDYNAKKFIHPKLETLPVLGNLESLHSLIKRGSALNPSLIQTENIRDIHFITLSSNTDIDAAISSLSGTGLFEYVEKDGIGTGAGVMTTTPSDPLFINQWSLKNNGSFSGTAVADADIDIDNAWDITTGDASTIVCVLDAGFKLDHPELAGRVWQNPGEIAGNGIDDDANGYVDDIQGWDWVNNDNNPTDDHGHGTNVASIIAARGNNGSHMAGINWNCKLMVGKVLNASNSGSYSWITSGIYYAVSMGAKVINISIGGTGNSAAMEAACDFAMANNVMIVVCMHNQNTSTPYYPAAYSSVIAVGSTSDNDWRTVPFPWNSASGSNYGSHIDLVAPGNNILGAYYLDNSSATYWSGTSQATPEVAAVISLMISLKPNLTFAQVMNILATTSEDQVGNPVEDTPGWDQYYGYGRLNAFAALNAVLAILPLKFGNIAVHRNNEENELKWTVFEEHNIQHYIVEYSKDRSFWQDIQQVQVQTTTASEKHYTFGHHTDALTDAFYRVKAIDLDGAYSYSKIVRILKEPGIYSINTIIASSNGLQVGGTSSMDVPASFIIYSMDGKIYTKAERQINKGNGLITLRVNLAAGKYQLVAMTKEGSVSKAFLVK